MNEPVPIGLPHCRHSELPPAKCRIKVRLLGPVHEQRDAAGRC
jgi:hypothetical protein